ncbi:TetR/AcrR family transcriptional regulator [Streptomyces sp. NPDC005438]|uniref:TetR/AcrR family transcriptional regulator n=1 Tax=Streptomyces sp. NPDC005438 TaxID=3156880 RepID=UPI0033B16E3A
MALSPAPLRVDAARNRQRIVTAAREAFVDQGAEFPLDEIARRAGVGNATVYRHFADRDALIREVMLEVSERIAQCAREALADHRGFEAVEHFVHEAIRERIGALCAMISPRVKLEDHQLHDSRQQLENLVEELLDRARAAGEIRPDVAVGDLMLAITLLTRPLPGAPCSPFDHMVARHIRLLLDGLRTPTPSDLPGAPPTLETLRQS